MKLKTYLKKHGLVAVAREIGMPSHYLWQIAEGIRTPSISTESGRTLIKKIIAVTDGQVTLKDLRPEECEFVKSLSGNGK